eukprot:4960063-Pleurochrysis_carterae.AAC.3
MDGRTSGHILRTNTKQRAHSIEEALQMSKDPHMLSWGVKSSHRANQTDINRLRKVPPKIITARDAVNTYDVTSGNPAS